MKRTHVPHPMQKPDATSSLVQVVTPDIIVHSGIAQLDRLVGGFKAGDMTLIDGNCELIADLPNHLCVNTYRTFHSDTIYIDGGMSANPYQIARYARMLEMDQRETLEHVVVSRAFTVYQLSTLVQDLLEPLLKTKSPRSLIIGMLPALYLDPDVPVREAQTLLKNDLQKLHELTTTYHLITIFTNLDVTPLSTNHGLGRILSSAVNETVRMKQFDHGIAVELVKQQKNTTIFSGAQGQLRLEEFGLVI